MRQLIAGNWKMNGLGAALGEVEALAARFDARPPPADVLVCPPATLLARAVAAAGATIAIGGQDCHPDPSGAFTGDVSAEMLGDAGAVAVIVGHSERRHYHAESDAVVAAKARAAWRAGLTAIVCIGETEEQRMSGRALATVATQIRGSVPDGASASNLVVAYEPVWAIGSGRTPTSADIVEMHAGIRAELTARIGAGAVETRILYGGSVKPANASEILALTGVDGALVGGASLKVSDFLVIVDAAAARP